MQRKLPIFFIQALAMSVALAASAHGTKPSVQQLRTQIHVIGDDALTQRFADALRAAIAASPKFAPVVSGSPYDIRLLLAGNLYWQDTTQGVNFNVVVVVTNGQGRFLGVSTGACWEAHMQDCAQTVLSDVLGYVADAPNNSVNRTQIPLRGLCAAYLGRYVAEGKPVASLEFQLLASLRWRHLRSFA